MLSSFVLEHFCFCYHWLASRFGGLRESQDRTVIGNRLVPLPFICSMYQLLHFLGCFHYEWTSQLHCQVWHFKKTSELHEIFDLVAIAFKCQQNFPRNIKLQFMRKDVNELIDLDSPIQLYDRANNELLIIPEKQLLLVNHQVVKVNLIFVRSFHVCFYVFI